MATPTLIVAGVSARLMAEAAARDGYRVIALDAFGDLDTRRASAAWLPIARPDALSIDGSLLLQALAGRGRERGVIGWVAGSGFDHAPLWLEQAAERLPLLGTAPAALRALRDPLKWFPLLARLGLAHPPTRLELPAEGVDRSGWLVKDLHASGGWSVRPAEGVTRLADSECVQRELLHATPISALFVADGQRAVLVGCQRQLVTTIGALRHVYAGVIGPITLAPRVLAAIERALAQLVPATQVRGLASLDLLVTDEADEQPIRVLELNARPPGSLALYPHCPLMRAHVDACRGELPSAAMLREGSARGGSAELRGLEIVYARRRVRIGTRAAQDLAARDDAHDLPAAGQSFDAGQPIASLSARGDDVGAVRAALARSREALLADLENPE